MVEQQKGKNKQQPETTTTGNPNDYIEGNEPSNKWDSQNKPSTNRNRQQNQNN